MGPGVDLRAVVSTAGRAFPAPEVPTDPFQHVLWDNIGYLIDDERRRRLFDAFAEAVGLTPEAIRDADDAVLAPLAAQGGMRPEERVRRWRSIAKVTLDHAGGDLDGTLRALPLAKARALLKRFPTIADPAADKILLFAGIAAQPSLESNGLRCLARLGFFAEQRGYDRNYRAAIAALVAHGPADGAWRRAAFDALRQLGKRVCKRGAPLCPACPLAAACPKVEVVAL